MEFLQRGKIWIFVEKSNAGIYNANLPALKRHAQKESYTLSTSRGTFEVWSLSGESKQTFEFPQQLGIVADEIRLQ